MAQRPARGATAVRGPKVLADALTRAGLDTLDFGFAIFDADLALVACNRAFRMLRGYPAHLCRPGTELVEFYRYNARRGDYGDGDVELHAQSRLVRVRARHAHELEYTTAAGQVLLVRYAPIDHGGLVLTYADVTARKAAEALAERTQTELKVALDNMPGALVYTDAQLRIVLCNDRFGEFYPVPRGLLEPGRPYPDFLRHLASHGYYGEGDVEAMVAKCIENQIRTWQFPATGSSSTVNIPFHFLRQ